MAVIIYPACRTVDDAGVILTGCTVTIASVLDLDGTAIASHGAIVHLSGSCASVAYDAAAKGEAWITLSVSKSGETITNENASPTIFASADPSRIVYLDASVSSRSTYAGGAVASVMAPITVGTNNDKIGYSLTAAYDSAKTAAQNTDMQTVINLLNSLNVVGPAGAGTSYVNVVVVDTNGNTIQNVLCWVSTDVNGANIVAGTLSTNSAGKVVFLLNPGSYYLWRQHPEFTFTNPTQLVVT